MIDQFEIGQGAPIIFTPTERPKGFWRAVSCVDGFVDHIGLHHFTVQTHFLEASRSQGRPSGSNRGGSENGFDVMFVCLIPIEQHLRQRIDSESQTRRRAAVARECGLKSGVAMFECVEC